MNNKILSWFTVIFLSGVLFSCTSPQEGGMIDLEVMEGMGALSGTVTASQPFQAAQVYARNLDKNVLYMVYTHNGQYQAINMMPGKYEIYVRKRGFSGSSIQATLAADERLSVDLEMEEAPAESAPAGEVAMVSYDELYPPGPDRELTEKTCIWCHGRNFFGNFQKTKEEWNEAAGRMSSLEAYPARGALIPVGALKADERNRIVEYLAENFGPGAPRRRVKTDTEFPVDEEALSRAMYVEFFLPLDKTPTRRAQDPYFDNEGNVWYTDRGQPDQVGRLDPRTATFTDFPLPDPDADPHGLTVDSEGMVFWSETRGLHLGRLNPETGEMVRFSMDPKGEIPGGSGHTPVLDSQENIWFTVITGNKLGKWDRETEEITLWEVPTPSSSPYGILVDPNDKIWLAEFRRGKVARFDPVTEEFTEFPSLTQPCTTRRLGLDSKGTIWYGGFGCGKLGKINPETGETIEYDIPLPFSEPYDVWPDPEDNIWISDGGQGGTLIKFNPESEEFTYYPTPRRTDQPKVEITREGAIWYCSRSAAEAAVGVLYPDMSKMTLGAYY